MEEGWKGHRRNTGHESVRSLFDFYDTNLIHSEFNGVSPCKLTNISYICKKYDK